MHSGFPGSVGMERCAFRRCYLQLNEKNLLIVRAAVQQWNGSQKRGVLWNSSRSSVKGDGSFCLAKRGLMDGSQKNRRIV